MRADPSRKYCVRSTTQVLVVFMLATYASVAYLVFVR